MPWPMDDKPVSPIANALVGLPQTTVTPEDIAKLIENDPLHYSYGLRAHTGNVAVGGYFPNSIEWDDGRPTGRSLDGTSTVSLGDWDNPASRDEIAQALKRLRGYGGDTVHLVGGSGASRSDTDEGEAVIRKARSLASWPRSQVLQDRAIGASMLNRLTNRE